MDHWNAPPRPNTYAEHMLIESILIGEFPVGSTLPGERTLASELGVTRPTLREALQRLARDGWLTVQQGKATVVNDYLQEGGLNVLSALVVHSEHLPEGFVRQLLEVRLQLAPAYTRAAVEQHAGRVSAVLAEHEALEDTPETFAAFDWRLHRQLTIDSENMIYAMIMNGFADFYEAVARSYFRPKISRVTSGRFYADLAAAAKAGDGERAQEVSGKAMSDSIALWEQALAVGPQVGGPGPDYGGVEFWR